MSRDTDILSPDRALIFRITHVSNLGWIFANGLHCSSSSEQDPSFVSIGNPEIVGRRASTPVPVPPQGTLADYVPFYFTPFSIMFFNIHTGFGGIPRRENDEIVFLVSSLPRLVETGARFVFTDRHGVLETARFFADTSQLGNVIDYALLRRRDFRRDPEDPEKVEKYQAEALVYKHVGIESLVGIACYSESVGKNLEGVAARHGHSIPVKVRRNWYFT